MKVQQPELTAQQFELIARLIRGSGLSRKGSKLVLVYEAQTSRRGATVERRTVSSGPFD